MLLLPATMAVRLGTLSRLVLSFPWLSLRGRTVALRGPLVLVVVEAARETQGNESVTPARHGGCASLAMSLVAFCLTRAMHVWGFAVRAARPC